MNFLKIMPLLGLVLLLACETPAPDQTDSRPNILLIVADDLGYADLGCYGGDIETPHIDQLASNGLRFSRFHTAPMCAPTRAMLLSGNDNHTAGMGAQGNMTEHYGYEGMLSDRIVPIPALLRDYGYHTYMAGKWHLGDTPEANPHQKGFEHSFVVIAGVGNHYNSQGVFKSRPVSEYYEDGKPAEWKEGNYSTDFYTDKLIEYIGRHKDDGEPFFAFAAYTSPHWPLQVDEKHWKKYEGRYDEGYEALKADRLESLKGAGMIPKDAVLPPNHPLIKPWDALSEKEKKKEARKMELYAGMVDNLDVNVGRLIQYLKDIGEYENTFIVFMSDNGAAAEDFYYHSFLGEFISENFSDEYEDMGKPHSFISYGPQWAEAGSSPFRYFKALSTEGALIAPIMMAGPGVPETGGIHDNFLTLMDLAPTFYEIAGAEYPEVYNNKPISPLKGESLMPFFSDQSKQIHDQDYVFVMEHYQKVLVRKGNWKLVNYDTTFAEENFRLYNLAEDLAEQHNIRTEFPEKYDELYAIWKDYEREVQVRFNQNTSD